MKFRLQDLIDMEQFQSLQDRLNEIYSFPSAIIDNDGTILTATAWQDVCTKFHRRNKECEKECIKSDQYITAHLHEANPAVSYRCPQGLIDNATPIIIDGQHLGNFFTGQFFLEKPDLDFFRKQAVKYGFDEEAYLDAVGRVPVWSQDQLQSYLFFIKGLIEVIASIGLKNMKVIDAGNNLKESEERHRTIIQTAMDGFWLIDLKGHFLQVNDAYSRMSGYPARELLTMNISDVEVTGDPDQMKMHIGKLMARSQDRFETRHRRKDGSVYDLEVSAQYHTLGGGRIVAFLHDITERKRTEKILRSREAFIRNILESVDEGFIVVDRAYRVLSANKAFCEFVGLSESKVIGRRCHEVSHHADAPCFEREEECPARKSFETGASHSVTHVHSDSGGGSRHVEIKTYPIADESGGVSSVIETINDITEKRKLEDQLRQAQKMEAIGTLAGGVAHDFNNILTAIIGYGNILKLKMRPDDPQQAALDQILTASDRAANLTQGLLAFSRKQAIHPRPVDLNTIVRSIENLLRRLIGEDVELSVCLSGTSLIVMADPGQIEQILMNLATNARDAMPEGGSLIISSDTTEPDDGLIGAKEFISGRKYACITFSDTGVGIDEETQEKIFEPFFTTKEQGKGTGLGLAIVYGIIKQHDGNINVYSEPGKGTTFKVYFPLIDAALMERQTETAAPPRGGTETILLAEDEEGVRELMRNALAGFGYRVITAADGQDALDHFAANAKMFDLAILDVIMPRKSGREVYDAMKTARPDLDVLFISGYTADIISRKGIFDEGIELLSKPLSPYALLRKIREMLDRRKENP